MYKLTLLTLIILVTGCMQDGYQNVGDIPFDASIDDENFKVCNERNIKQYYLRRSSDAPPSYRGEKRALEQAILSEYSFPEAAQENGYLTIRFIVNCEGAPGRFRVEEMDFSYQPKTFDPQITSQLLRLVKNLTDWVPRKRRNTTYDFYQYLTFKIQKGQVIEILP
ncbi:MAG: hypothetical protein AAF798_04675 [Bacteroidota bacterium]